MGFTRPASAAIALVAGLCAAGPPVVADSRAQVVGRFADVNGIRMYYEIHGRGPALILLHGGAGYGRQFLRQVPAFERSHQVIVPDECAQGRSTDRPDSLSYHAMAEDIATLMDTLHLRRADVLGWSDGGVIGLDLAVHHPDRVNHLVVMGANFSPDGLDAKEIAWNDTATAADFGPEVRREIEQVSPQPAHVMEALDKIIVMWRTQPRFTLAELGSIRARTLVAAGEHDVVRRDHTEQLARAIPGARLWIVPGASHRAMQEQPDLVNRTVLEFLSH